MKKPAGAIQLDVTALYEALDHERQRRKMMLTDVADELCVNYSTLACWRRGGGMNADALVRVSLWMPIDLRRFTRQDPVPATQKAA